MHHHHRVGRFEHVSLQRLDNGLALVAVCSRPAVAIGDDLRLIAAALRVEFIDDASQVPDELPPSSRTPTGAVSGTACETFPSKKPDFLAPQKVDAPSAEVIQAYLIGAIGAARAQNAAVAKFKVRNAEHMLRDSLGFAIHP